MTACSKPLLSVWSFLAVEGWILSIHSGPHTRQFGFESSFHTAPVGDCTDLHFPRTTSGWQVLVFHVLPIELRSARRVVGGPVPSVPFWPSCGHETSVLPRDFSVFFFVFFLPMTNDLIVSSLPSGSY